MILRQEIAPGVVRGGWWQHLPDGRFQCDLCPRHCKLRAGQHGFCFVREARADGIYLTSYGRASGFCIDPIEKKPLNHFYPGSSVLSFGTAGCNLGCRFCQNWAISKARSNHRQHEPASPSAVAEAALRHGCRSVAFTYNDPIIFAEYAIDCAAAAHDCGLRAVAVSAGYIEKGAREQFFGAMDAANIDLKALADRFYRRLCFAALRPVLDTLRYLANDTGVWLEVTNLIIPGENDDDDDLVRLSDWIAAHLGPETPVHFSAFHPDYKMAGHPPTPPTKLQRARELARQAGLKHVYTGNVHNPEGEATYCAGCGNLVIGRDWFEVGEWRLDETGACISCGRSLAGCFGAEPGRWGRKRRAVWVG